ncbi:MAG TPA: non-heme iron oxygenase ferredoxin subunit [Frankiaceae bacterium]|nr:non-heme iron oxygenase ferredoxin subunit [Frankiaceae bacterium]
MSEFRRVCALSDLDEESALHVDVDGTPVCVARSHGRVYAVRDVCSHAEVPLSEGDVEDGTVECWLHGSRFDLATGKPIGLPATVPVPVYPVKTEGDDVLVAVADQ